MCSPSFIEGQQQEIAMQVKENKHPSSWIGVPLQIEISQILWAPLVRAQRAIQIKIQKASTARFINLQAFKCIRAIHMNLGTLQWVVFLSELNRSVETCVLTAEWDKVAVESFRNQQIKRLTQQAPPSPPPLPSPFYLSVDDDDIVPPERFCAWKISSPSFLPKQFCDMNWRQKRDKIQFREEFLPNCWKQEPFDTQILCNQDFFSQNANFSFVEKLSKNFSKFRLSL